MFKNLYSSFISLLSIILIAFGNKIMNRDPKQGHLASYQRGQHMQKHHSRRQKIHFPALNSSAKENGEQEKIEVYLRSASKKAIKILVPHKMTLTDIKAIIQERLGIESGKQLLHLNGKDITDYAHIQLDSLNIIHVANRQKVLKQAERVQIKVIIISSFDQNGPKDRLYFIKGNQKVEGLINQIKNEQDDNKNNNENELNPFYSLLQSSRLLQKERSFYDQNVTEGAELICLITKNELRTRFNNDTNEDILNDIANLLQSDAKLNNQAKNQENSKVSQQISAQINNERQDLFDESSQRGNYKRQRRQSLSSEEGEQQLENAQRISDAKLNFKKKKQPQLAYSLEAIEKPSLKRLKAKRSKKQLDQLLKKQGKNNIFYREDTIQIKQGKKNQQCLSPQKTVASIPKVMPVQQRRKINLQIEKLFDTSMPISMSKPISIQEQSPKSPPTEEPPRLQKSKKKMNNLRLSMGSRPAFLESLKVPLNTNNN